MGRTPRRLIRLLPVTLPWAGTHRLTYTWVGYITKVVVGVVCLLCGSLVLLWRLLLLVGATGLPGSVSGAVDSSCGFSSGKVRVGFEVLATLPLGLALAMLLLSLITVTCAALNENAFRMAHSSLNWSILITVSTGAYLVFKAPLMAQLCQLASITPLLL